LTETPGCPLPQSHRLADADFSTDFAACTKVALAEPTCLRE
jgi:hypothetical protein